MIEEPFAAGVSTIHRLNPGIRVVSAVLISFAVALSNRFETLWAALFFALILIFIARLDLRIAFKQLAAMWIFLLFLWAALPLTFGTDALYHIGPLPVTRSGLLMAGRISLKSSAILMIFMALVATMTFVTLGHTLSRLRVPRKLVSLLLLTYRYIFVIEQEYQRLLRAARLRGFCPGTNLHTYRTYAWLAGMLFVRASARAERVWQAMKCRGFRGEFYCLREYTVSGQDWIWAGVMTGGFAGLLALEYLITL